MTVYAYYDTKERFLQPLSFPRGGMAPRKDMRWPVLPIMSYVCAWNLLMQCCTLYSSKIEASETYFLMS